VDWVFDGSVAEGKVLLVKSRFDLDRRLATAIDNDHYLGREECVEAIFATDAEKFYCNNANTISPRDVVQYHAWLRKNHPESKQQVLLLERGVNGLYSYLREQTYSDEMILKVVKRVRGGWW
jgi:hypothetical protein